MKNTLNPNSLCAALASHLQSADHPGEIISVENMRFYLNGDIVSVDKISFDTKITHPKRGRPSTKKPKPETGIPRHELLLRNVTHFNFPVPVQNFLKRAGILYVWQLAFLSDNALYQVSGIGKVSIRIIRKNLMEIPDFDHGTEMSLRNRFFRRIFGVKSSEVKNPADELKMVVCLKDERLDEVESFIRSTVAV